MTAFATADEAREWAEDLILAPPGCPRPSRPVVARRAQPVRGLDAEGVAVRRRERWSSSATRPGEVIYAAGSPADRDLPAARRRRRHHVTPADGIRRRFATVGPGADVRRAGGRRGGAPRTADATAASDVLVAASPPRELMALERPHPDVLARVLHNILAGACESVARLTEEITALSGGAAPPPAQLASSRPVARR